MTKQDCEQSSYQTKNNANTKSLRNWTMVWVVTMAIAAFAPRFIWDFNTSLTIITLLVNLAVGFRMLVANRDYLRGLDEMQQKILFDAMAVTLGVGLVVGLSYELLEDIKLIAFEPEISHLIIVMCLTNLTAIIAGHRKYR
ncbi:hypothetical protein [Colwellia psychrerythraea]|uniref:Uncharacterized protein n=1 Tax=Colwellia psychrerythraea TaxID=28229 RepID=A0A099KA46_COLPS|nr:hypothetical protein [Colwellia psychrerythraea]KGJ87216.1 hypothetical protein ND2E_0623 [Colwellia psychrerythraea]